MEDLLFIIRIPENAFPNSPPLYLYKDPPIKLTCELTALEAMEFDLKTDIPYAYSTKYWVDQKGEK